MYLEQFFVDGLGCASYLVGCETQGIAAVIDPDREVGKYLDSAGKRRLKITHIIETHLHADHVSGNTELQSRTGAGIFLHKDANVKFPHQPLDHGDSLQLGRVRLEVRHTPGHTPESITLLVTDGTRSTEPWLALTGDTLFVGDIGRPDLVGAGEARQLAELMFDSLATQILPLEDDLLLFPGHGAGSLCGKSIAPMRQSSLGFERKHNPALSIVEREQFTAFATASLPEQPGNHHWIKTLNRKGPRLLGEVQPQALSIREAIPHFQRGAALIDTRPKGEFVEKHIPGSIHLPADEQLSGKVGFILPPEAPIVLLVEGEATYIKVYYSLARVGFENLLGYLAEDLDAWEARGLPVVSGDIQDISVPELQQLLEENEGEPLIVDVREPWEYHQGHIPGAQLIPLGELAQRTDELDPNRPVVLVCATGNRSQTAAAVLGGSQFEKIYNLLEGTLGWRQHGLPLER
jgi:hydroxyacylglutathione hydrolase